MYQTPSGPPPDNTYSNGKLSPGAGSKDNVTGIDTDSDSDLSEPLDLPNPPAPFLNGERSEGVEDQEDETSELDTSHNEDALGSDDPDYGFLSPSRPKGRSISNARSSSQDSPRQRKRKSGVEQDDFILNDPELYGLRRSVSALATGNGDFNADISFQGRPRPTRHIVGIAPFPTPPLLD